MSSQVTDRLKRERQQDWRLLQVVVAVAVLLAVTGFAWAYAPAYLALSQYRPQEGDILFQSLPHSRLVDAIEGATESPYSHCGIIGQQDGRWIVYEAYRKVEATPLSEFIFRGRRHGFAAFRLKPVDQPQVPEMMRHVRGFLGRPYDSRYRMDDEQIYCSELVYKAFEKATGQQLGNLVAVRDLNWLPYEATIRHYEKGPPPLDRKMITPKNLAGADQLDLVYSYNQPPPHE